MQILIVASTMAEIEPFISVNPRFDFLITGVGVPEALYHISRRLHQVDYDIVIQAGIAGRFDKTFGLGEVVIVHKDCFADLGIYEKEQFYTLFEKGFGNKDQFPYKDGWLVNPGGQDMEFDYRNVSGITVNTITDDAYKTEQLRVKYNPSVESMEGAALHFVCLQEDIPFIQLRSISNDVGERDKTKWEMVAAIKHLNDALGKIIQKIVIN